MDVIPVVQHHVAVATVRLVVVIAILQVLLCKVVLYIALHHTHQVVLVVAALAVVRHLAVCLQVVLAVVIRLQQVEVVLAVAVDKKQYIVSIE